MKTILVTGATGHQGGAVVAALRAAEGEWRIRAATRKPDSARAKALGRDGIELVAADLDRPDELADVLRGVYGVFGVGPRGGREAERGIALAEAAARAGVEHYVYSSVGGVERVRGIPHFDNKWLVEQRIRELGLPATMLRPTSYMEGFATPMVASIGLGMLASVLGENKTLQMISVRDIGVFAALAFADPDEYLGRALEIAGDELAVPEISAITGRAYLRMPQRLLRMMGPESRMFFWFGESGYRADIPALRRLHPNLLTLREWMAEHR
ncbi:NAD(P)H-binding protein [Nocardia sp. ET3-3]|uniref:NAD(P)H-binding protein n=1 Tax=Nocardia terrae TaxID=2675851 RepID=A0A7K1V971_9NOCA|nr:NmrA/HSCARG family protein [Nocardia terrae]MVU83126.1 NAD(P)H-binding protein [Nocardia terrae]